MSKEVRAKFQAASDALFALEQAISPNADDPHRIAVYRVRVALGNVENARRQATKSKPTIATVDSAIYGRRPIPEGHRVCQSCRGQGIVTPDGSACVCAIYGQHPGFEKLPGVTSGAGIEAAPNVERK